MVNAIYCANGPRLNYITNRTVNQTEVNDLVKVNPNLVVIYHNSIMEYLGPTLVHLAFYIDTNYSIYCDNCKKCWEIPKVLYGPWVRGEWMCGDATWPLPARACGRKAR